MTTGKETLVNSASNYDFNPCHNGFPEEVHKACPAAAHTLLWNDPLHAIVTLKEDGTVQILGMESTYYCYGRVGQSLTTEKESHMIIDDHNHAEYYGYSARRMVENMDAYGIDKTVLLSWECPEDEWDPETKHLFSWRNGGSPVPFESVLDYWRQYPDRFILGYAPDPRRPDAIHKLKSAIGLYDIRICGELKLRMMLDDWDAIRLYRFCGDHGLPVLVHIDYEFDRPTAFPRRNWWYGGGMDAFERAIKACPETNFIGHAPGFWAHISDDGQFDKTAYPTGPVVGEGAIVRMLRQYPNLYCDISAGSGHNALARDPEFTRGFLVEFADRVLYGRDAFGNIHQPLIDSLGLPDEVREKIYYKNTARLLRLEV